MRDPNRIFGFLARLTCAWRDIPDARFGQLLFNVAAYHDMDENWFFYVEDDEMIRLIEEYVKAQTNQD